MKELITKALKSSVDYVGYRRLVSDLISKGLTSGPNLSESLIYYTQLNEVRMNRWDKKYRPSTETQRTMNELNRDETWLVLTEAWCGDAAHSVPILAKIASLNPKINLQLTWRDENVDLMDMNLTSGGRSIPKLIRLNENTEQIGQWGPRPKYLQDTVMKQKRFPTMPKDEFKIWINTWYNKDKGRSLEKEITQMIAPVEV